MDDPVEKYLHELVGSPVGRATMVHLLNHSSGLPGWRPLYERIAEQRAAQGESFGADTSRQLALEVIGREPLEYQNGTRSVYSDLGFILLGMVVERVAACGLDRFCAERIYKPIGARPLFFKRTKGSGVDDAGDGIVPPIKQVAPTEHDPRRDRLLRGEVHDDNAHALGGVAGHAGLFGTAMAVLTVSGLWLQSYLKRQSFLSPDLVRRFVSRQGTAGSSWGLGWDTPSSPSSSGSHFSSQAFGHLGFTGTSVWVDPVAELEVVLLSNRVHPTRENVRIHKFRPYIHDLIYEEMSRRR
jgi:CubicO group peptidase (beta-lactamase class C family)